MERIARKGSSSALRQALFPAGFAGEVMSLIKETWAVFSLHHDVRLEERLTAVFADALIKAYERRNWPWFIIPEVPITDPTFGTQTGRNDLRFYHRAQPGQSRFFVVECKRLHVRTASGFRHLSDEYIEEGLMRFVDGRYSASQPVGGMIGYVMDDDIEAAFERVGAEVKAKKLRLEIRGKITMQCPSSVLSTCAYSADTFHHRSCGSILIHHLLLKRERMRSRPS